MLLSTVPVHRAIHQILRNLRIRVSPFASTPSVLLHLGTTDHSDQRVAEEVCPREYLLFRSSHLLCIHFFRPESHKSYAYDSGLFPCSSPTSPLPDHSGQQI